MKERFAPWTAFGHLHIVLQDTKDYDYNTDFDSIQNFSF
jgi:hypothetical protein